MDNSYINKIEKAKIYASEPERITFHEFVATVRGDNAAHTVTFKDGVFESDGEFHKNHGYSAHSMALERILKGMIPSPAAGDGHPASDSTYINKVEKAKIYAAERERITFLSFRATVRGDNSEHEVRYDNGQWDSDSSYFKTHGYSAHTMTLERVLEGMIPSRAHSPSED
ncbi:MAG: hypothetical protein ACLFTK_09210 [Anaerolineales bacterium]